VTRALAIQFGVAAVAGTSGLALLARPAAFGVRDEPARYAARIAGMMLAALGLFLGGFATIYLFNT
jgi:hypothetical protein